MHASDTPLCCNPTHVSPATQRENMADCKAKGRLNLSGFNRRGEQHGQAKLHDADVLAIRAVLDSHSASQRALARKFHVDHKLISLIGKRKIWRHLP